MATERWTDEMLDRFASTVSVTLAGIGNAQIGLSQQVDQFINRTDQTLALLEETTTRLEQAITELKAGQEQQSRLLDYLIRRNGQGGE